LSSFAVDDFAVAKFSSLITRASAEKFPGGRGATKKDPKFSKK